MYNTAKAPVANPDAADVTSTDNASNDNAPDAVATLPTNT